MRRYLGICGVFRSSWSASAAIHYNEGMRQIGVYMLQDIQDSNPEILGDMMSDALKEDL
jgi:hypothetical protein